MVIYSHSPRNSGYTSKQGRALTMKAFQFSTTKSIISESGSIQRLAEICASQGIKRPYVVTDGGIVACGLMDVLTNALKGSDLVIGTYADVVADPAESIVLAGVDGAIAHKADGIIGFGGGSSMDTAKLVALLANTSQKLSDTYGINQATGERLPLILIPTTAGTGSEVTQIAIVTTGESTKAGVVAPQLLPDIAILDAELTLGLPAHVTAATGIDAMVHAIEAYTSAHKKNPYSDLLAKQALELLSQNIELACTDGDNVDARQGMLLGACMAGQAFANSPVAAVHALAYPLGGRFHIPHGLSNSLVLPHVMRFNAKQAATLYAELAPHISAEINTQQDPEAVALDLVGHLEALIKRLKLPTTLREMDITADQLDMLADDAMQQTRLLINNPKEVTRADALAIYKAAF
jgi:alcohol dehydrogenase class IV